MPEKMIVVLDFGGREAVRVARMIRSARVYCEVLPWDTPLAQIRARSPRGIVAVGGAQQLRPDGPQWDMGLFSLAVPVLAMGCGARALCVACGGALDGTLFENVPKKVPIPDMPLFHGMQGGNRMIDQADRMIVPKGFSVLSAVDGAVMVLVNDSLKCTGIQFTPESNDVDCQQLLANFAIDQCGCKPVWTMQVFLEETISMIRARVGQGDALLVLTGGVDSSVCAALMHRAIGDRLHCLMVDTGLLRSGEVDSVCQLLRPYIGQLAPIDIAQRIYARLSGVTQAAIKRQVIDEEWAGAVHEAAQALGKVDFHVRATIYPDVIDPNSGLAQRQQQLDSLVSFHDELEPLRQLFKDEVRALGELLGLPEQIITRPQFPRHGLAVRCIGSICERKLSVLRQVDAIFRDEVTQARLGRSLSQYFVVLADCPEEPGRYLAILRAMRRGGNSGYVFERLPYDFLEQLEEKIISGVPQVYRVMLDLTASEHAPVEWE